MKAAEGDIAPPRCANHDERGDADAGEQEYEARGEWQEQPSLRPAQIASAPPEIGGDEDPGEADPLIARAFGGDADGKTTGTDCEIGWIRHDLAADQPEQAGDNRESPL